MVCFFKSDLVEREKGELRFSVRRDRMHEDTRADPGLRTDTVEFPTYRIQSTPCEHYVRRFCKLKQYFNTVIKLPKK